jgi:hypothetical protein
MKPADRSVRFLPAFRRTIAVAILLGLAMAAPLVSGPIGKDVAKKDDAPQKPAKKPAEGGTAGAVEVQFIDDSTMKLTLRDERVTLNTPYGKLLIPVRDIQRIEMATRIPDDVAKRIAAAIADLGKVEFPVREAATTELMELGERAYPALVEAEKSKDLEVKRRAREVLEKIREEVPAERLEFHPHDVIYTEDSKFTGRIEGTALKVHTFQFGQQQLKLSDVRGLRSKWAIEPEPANALPDPGNLSSLFGQVGKIYTYRITGGGQAVQQGFPPGGIPPGRLVIINGGGGNVWGTDTYTLDSSLSLAAVHAGMLKVGQTGVVRVKILGPQPGFQGSTRNGVTSHPFGPFTGAFQFVRGRGRARPPG